MTSSILAGSPSCGSCRCFPGRLHPVAHLDGDGYGDEPIGTNPDRCRETPGQVKMTGMVVQIPMVTVGATKVSIRMM